MSDRKRAVDILDGLICSHVGKKDMINELLDNIIELVKEEVPRWTFAAELQPDEPQLIQGYTAENWQDIIDGGYLCEFWGSGNKSIGKLDYIKDNVLDDHPFQQEDDSDWTNCRPAQLKGVMRPIFVEPVDKDAWCVFFYDDATGEEGAAHHTYNDFFSGGLTISNTEATCYIEL